MISVDQKVTDAVNKNYSLDMNIGATMDINCNTLIVFEDADVTGYTYATINDKQPFKKLFPAESIIKPFRPQGCGIKYAISGDIATAGTWADPRNYKYIPSAGNTYRTYYPSKDLYYKYYVTQLNGNATLNVRYYTASASVSSANKQVPANKIVLKFELAHATPSSWTVLVNGSDVTSGLSKTIPSNGVVELFYTGSGWSRSESAMSASATVMVSTLGMTATNPGGYIGVIELAPHWVIDLTSYITGMNITKEASNSNNDILPIGDVTANSLDLSLNGYSNSLSGNVAFTSFDKYLSDTIDSSKIYFSKHAEIKAFIKVYDASGTYSDSKGSYFKVPQGTFYIDNWNIQEYGEAEVFGLDSAKILQETICPDMVCDNYSFIGILRRVLDSVGFTAYNFNYTATDQSILSPAYWWSDSTKTVWAIIQEICNDTQMSAVVDENNILQFYSRDYMFSSSRSNNFAFRYSEDPVDSTLLPNIVELNSIRNVPIVNQVKILYNSVYMPTYDQSDGELMSVQETILKSASLLKDIAYNDDPLVTPGTKFYISLDPVNIVPKEIKLNEILESYSGYLLINSEIIEYDAIEYEFVTAIADTINGISYSIGATVPVDITGPNDILKYRGNVKLLTDSTGSKSIFPFNPTGRYRIKTRAALGTSKSAHTANINIAANKNDWMGYKKVIWK